MTMRYGLDLFSGTRSATRYFALNGWEMEYIDLLEGKDVMGYHPQRAFDFIWASPPCTEYSYFNRSFGTWLSKYQADRTLWLRTLFIISAAKPRFWIIENVKGAQQVWGRAPYHYGPYFLWGYFPLEGLPKIPWTTSVKGTHADRQTLTAGGNILQWDDGLSARQKAMIPDALARAVYEAISGALA